MQTLPLSFESSPQGIEVSALLTTPGNPNAILVLGHGAGAGMDHVHMQSIAASLGEAGIAALRFNFPYMQAGRRRTDSKSVCIETIGRAVAFAHAHLPRLPLFVGGHSFGGRMASHFAAEAQPDISGLVYYSFPLHPARRPDTKRADHLVRIRKPQLFLSGTRDALADLSLLRDVASNLAGARLHELDTADHGFRIRPSRTTAEDVYHEAARVAAAFIG